MKAPEDPPEDVQLASTLCVLAGKKQFQVLPESYQQRYLRMARAARRALDADSKELKRLRKECADVGAQAVHDAQMLMEAFQLLGQYERDPETAQKRMRKGDMYERLVNVLSGVLTTLGVHFTPTDAGVYEGLLTVVSRLKQAERTLQATTSGGDAALRDLTGLASALGEEFVRWGNLPECDSARGKTVRAGIDRLVMLLSAEQCKARALRDELRKLREEKSAREHELSVLTHRVRELERTVNAGCPRCGGIGDFT